MLKRLPVLTIVLFFLGIANVFAQGIIITTVDPGPYTPGSSIAALFTGSITTNLRPDNKFELWLSDANGNFATESRIGVFNGFYGTYVNGVIPLTTVPGSGYRLRIKTSSPVSISSNTSAPFFINAGGVVKAKITVPSNKIISAADNILGSCTTSGRANNNFNFTNESTATSSVSASSINESTGGPAASFDFSGGVIRTFTAVQTTNYTVFAKALMPDGRVATQAYMLVNNRAITAFGTTGTSDLCLGGPPLEFNVIVNGSDGIINNYPGNTYRVNWGDNKENVYTLLDITSNNNKVAHNYTGTACGSAINLGSTTIYNAFGISIFAQNEYCGTVGTPISTTAKVSLKPVNGFSISETTCLNTLTEFTNTSDLGETPETNGRGCQPNDATFTWYIDGNVVPGAIDKPKSFKLSYNFTTPGNHTITLEASSTAPCPPDPVSQVICVQEQAKPSFTLNGVSTDIGMCSNDVLTPVNTSFVDNSGCGSNTYNWEILPNTYTLLGGTTVNSPAPQIKFAVSGEYTIRLIINASKCGEVATPIQNVRVSSIPTATLSPNKTLCNYGTYNFNETGGITKTVITGTPVSAQQADTYAWTVDGSAADYAFVNGTTAASRYPSIQFKAFRTFTITVKHKNGCNEVTANQVLTFNPSPIVLAGGGVQVCYDGDAQLHAALVPGYTPVWVGGGGIFTPDRNSKDAIYSPTVAERNAGSVALSWQITTNLPAPCNTVEDIALVSIKPVNKLTSVNKLSVCSGTKLSYKPISTVTGSTFTWTVVGTTGGVTGANIGSGTTITDLLALPLNSSASGTVTYRINPISGNCTGIPMDLIVTVTPTPVLTAIAAKLSICTRDAVSIAISNNLPVADDVKYVYSSSVSRPEITGNTTLATPAMISAIDDILINTGTVAGTVTYTITPMAGSGCPGASKVIVITVNPQGSVANAGADETICSNVAYPLEANVPANNETGKWTVTSGQTVTFADATKYNSLVSGLLGGQSYTFKWTITTAAGCFTTDDVIITNLLPLGNINITASTAPVCKGQEVTVTGQMPTGGNGLYTYSWESSTDNGANWKLMPDEISKDLVVNVVATTAYRRITHGGICVLFSNEVKITMYDLLANNTISTAQSICLGLTAAPLTGSLPTGGDGVYYYQWQQSVDGGTSWTNISGATNSDYSPTTVSVTMKYRRIVKTTICTGYAELASNEVTVEIKPHAKAEFTVVSQEECAPFAIDAFNIKAVSYSDRNAIYTWYSKTGNGPDVLIGTGINFPGYTIATEDTFVTIKLVVTSSRGCNIDQTAHTFNTLKNVHASYTQDKISGCGPLLVNFTNTSNITAGVNFKWDFGNGQTATDADPGIVNFAADPTGKDRVYVVTLNASTACGASQVFTSSVTVRSTPISIFSPGSTLGCAPLGVTFVNTSPESTGTSYTYDWGDGTVAQTFNDNADVVHTYSAVVKTTLYVVKMTAKNECGENTSEHTISIAPNTIIAELVVDAKDKQGCAPLLVHFSNNSGNAISYMYDFGDGTTQTSTTSPEKISHTFIQPGTYVVKLTAMNNCTSTTTTESITVFEQPDTRFTIDKTVGYPGLKFQFNNTTIGGIKYLWDFGDGTTSAEVNPSHSYGQTGTFKVILTASNVAGCPSSYTIDVLVDGEPGTLFVPNSFIPSSEDPQFREFKAKGTGIANWRMSIFDKWGALLWQTTRLDEGKPVEGWDGTYKGQKMPQGVYYWKIDLQLRNGTEWKGVTLNATAPKRTGTINLIR
ncbi:gliding motility-associated-like protein [Pedobacter sp. UYP24]